MTLGARTLASRSSWGDGVATQAAPLNETTSAASERFSEALELGQVDILHQAKLGRETDVVLARPVEVSPCDARVGDAHVSQDAEKMSKKKCTRPMKAGLSSFSSPHPGSDSMWARSRVRRRYSGAETSRQATQWSSVQEYVKCAPIAILGQLSSVQSSLRAGTSFSIPLVSAKTCAASQ
eukprot:CAMPEP_0180565272 /NCGR_PEP_ID=MMETSP1037_2-20121125/5457_1 /TAXON_ID=632150 /ORGANISM="Azadinium spinosum, Strain 3D9" /LENGTH=179 /DNA_ID=CAMNT_0022582231 /DNA_START=16 /DNA_END=554 /DNA_ORIENTATION=+